MTVQTPEQEMCRLEGDTVTVLLRSTTLVLSMEEADSLNCILQTDLLHGVFDEMDGQEVSNAVLIADVSVPRSEAWELHRILDNLIDADDVAVVDGEDWIQERVSSHGRVNWLESGF